MFLKIAKKGSKSASKTEKLESFSTLALIMMLTDHILESTFDYFHSAFFLPVLDPSSESESELESETDEKPISEEEKKRRAYRKRKAQPGWGQKVILVN